jgi:hypothetical protein
MNRITRVTLAAVVVFLLGMVAAVAMVEDVSAADLSQKDIYSASKSVKNYVDKNGVLPNFVTIKGKQYSMPEYEYMVSKAIITKDSGKNNNIKIKTNIKHPSKPSGDNINQVITRKQIVTISKNTVNFIDKNNQAPNFVTLGTKKIQYQTYIYGVARVGTFLNDNNKMPNTLTLNVKNSHSMNKKMPTISPAPDNHVSFMATQDFLNGATNVKNYIDTHAMLPNFVTIAGKQYDMPSYFAMASNVIASQGVGALSNQIPVYYINAPVLPKGDLISSHVPKSFYYDMSMRSADFCSKNGRAPSTIAFERVDMDYYTTLYMFSKVLDSYNKNKVMPESVFIQTMKQ